MNQTSYRSSQDSAVSTPGRQLGKRFKQPDAVFPAQPEIALIAEIAAEPGRDQQQPRVEQTLRRRERGEQHDRLALEECPDENKEDRR